MTSQERLLDVHAKGFRVSDEGVALKPDGSIQPVTLDKWGYWRFSVKNTDGKTRCVLVHRLAAFQKFGMALFEPGIEVRHLNGSMDNRAQFIGIGTASQNAMDKPPAVRKQMAGRAARKLTDEQVRSLRKDREAGATYKELCLRYGLQKSTISYIVNGKTKYEGA